MLKRLFRLFKKKEEINNNKLDLDVVEDAKQQYLKIVELDDRIDIKFKLLILKNKLETRWYKVTADLV